MRQANRAFTPREINFGLWVIVGALLLSAAGVIANGWLLSPSLGQYSQATVRQTSSDALEARPLADARAVMASASAG